MQFVQGGADFTVPSGARKTKSLLKKLLKEDPSQVYLYDTSAFGSKFSGSADSLPEGTTFNVVGPDPYTKRDWYASVEKTPRGIKCA